jgi:hypothetical protein
METGFAHKTIVLYASFRRAALQSSERLDLEGDL